MRTDLLFIMAIIAIVIMQGVHARPANSTSSTTLQIHPGWPKTVHSPPDIWLGLLAPGTHSLETGKGILLALPGTPGTNLLAFSENGSLIINRTVPCAVEPSSIPSRGNILAVPGEEIIVPCRANHLGSMLIMTSNGTIELLPVPWKLSDTHFGAFVLADLDEDGLDDIIAGGDNDSGSYLVAMHANGTLFAGFPVYLDEQYSEANTPAVGRDIIVVSRPQNWEAGSVVRSFSREGLLRWERFFTGYLFGDPVLADITGDGRQEIIVSSEHGVLVLTADGSSLFNLTLGSFSISTPLAAADLLSFPGKEIIIGYNTGLFIIANGTVQVSVHANASFVSTPLVGDIDGDGREDILAIAGDKLYAVTPAGLSLRGFPKSLSLQTATSPVLEDIDADGRLELIVISAWNSEEDPFGIISVWDARGSHASWPHYQQNAQHTGNAQGSNPPRRHGLRIAQCAAK